MFATEKAKAGIIAFFLLLFLPAALFAADPCTKIYGDGHTIIILATGSPGELGLLQILAEEFNKTHDTRICWKKAGSGL